MKQFLKMVKKYDIVVIVFLIALSLLPFTIFTIVQASQTGDTVVASIIHDGEVIREITLTGHTGNEQFLIEGPHNQYNLMEVDGERIRIKEDNSPDQIGVKMGWKDKPGQTIICLPHKLFVELRLEGNQTYEEEIIISQ